MQLFYFTMFSIKQLQELVLELYQTTSKLRHCLVRHASNEMRFDSSSNMLFFFPKRGVVCIAAILSRAFSSAGGRSRMAWLEDAQLHTKGRSISYRTVCDTTIQSMTRWPSGRPVHRLPQRGGRLMRAR